MDDRIQKVELKTIEREIENYKRKISRCEEDLQHYKEELRKKVNHRNFLEDKIKEKEQK